MLLTTNQQLLRKTEEFVLEITDLESESLFPLFLLSTLATLPTK